MILIGRKPICEYLSGVAWNTVLRYIQDYGLPVWCHSNDFGTGRPGWQPMALSEDLDEWARAIIRGECMLPHPRDIDAAKLVDDVLAGVGGKSAKRL